MSSQFTCCLLALALAGLTGEATPCTQEPLIKENVALGAEGDETLIPDLLLAS